jgi:hypothetical protein
MFRDRLGLTPLWKSDAPARLEGLPPLKGRKNSY